MRKSDRSPVQIPVEFTPWDPRHLAFGVVTNVSLGGIHVETAFPSPPGSDLVVVVWRPGWKEEVLLAGIVCWSTAEGMGLRFASEGEHEANAVSAMLAAPDRDAAVARRSS